MQPDAQAVLDFWFADALEDPAKCEARGEFWFGANPQTDTEIQTRFGNVLMLASMEQLNDWTQSPQGRLALIITLDQFPRNIYRAQPEAFAHDDLALELMIEGLETNTLDKLHPVQQGFFLMPTQHSEDISVQQQGLNLYQTCEEKAPEPWQPQMKQYREFAQAHLEIIQRFGRFPHRNAILGRTNTQEETDYLNAGGSTFGQ